MRFVKRLLALSLVWLMGCAEQITEGEVYSKRLIPSHTVEVDDTTFITVGDITVPIVSSHTETIPDQWYITFRKIDEKKKDWVYREVNVTLETYNQYNNGDHISFNPE